MDRTAVVTGADRGLGLALCKGLLAKGWTVFAGQYMEAWPELSALVSEYPESLHIIALDVSSDESVKSGFGIISGITDRVDMLISNAGVSGRDGDIREGMNLTVSKRISSIILIYLLTMQKKHLLFQPGR